MPARVAHRPLAGPNSIAMLIRDFRRAQIQFKLGGCKFYKGTRRFIAGALICAQFYQLEFKRLMSLRARASPGELGPGGSGGPGGWWGGGGLRARTRRQVAGRARATILAKYQNKCARSLAGSLSW